MPCRKIICVLGMHRSGTSLLAQTLHANGVQTGPKRVAKSSSNTEGHLEDRFVVTTNKKLLLHLGGTWDRPPTLPENWLEDPFVKKLLGKARDYRRKTIEACEYFFFKDPRVCLLVPFWKDAFGEMLYIVVLRHQNDVARSLVHRQTEWLRHSHFLWRWARFCYHSYIGAYEPLYPLNVEQVLDLWRQYNERIVEFTSGMEVEVVTYEQLLAHPRETVQRVMTRVNQGHESFRSDVVQSLLNHGEQQKESREELTYCQRLGADSMLGEEAG